MLQSRSPLPFALALLAGVSAAVTVQAAEPDVVEATGEAAIVNGDKAMAKERATQAALRNAVEQALGTVVVSDSETRDFQLTKDAILTSSTGYVSGYDVVESKEDSGTMLVKVRARVGKEKLAADAAAKGLTLRRMKMPRMAILIAEQHIGQTAPNAWWGPQGGGQQQGQVIGIDQRLAENTLIDEWGKVGFTFVDMQALAGKLKAANVASLNPSADQAREIGNLSDAEVIIVGTAVATKQGDLGKLLEDKSGGIQMTSCKASISARVFNADNGEILATAEAGKTALHIDTSVCNRKALIDAARVFAADMQTKLLEKWNANLSGGARVRMSVRGLDSFRALTEFKSALGTDLRGVQSVEQKAFKDGVADLDLKLQGGTEAFAGDLEARPLRRFKIRVVSLTANTIDVELAK
jgi:hypothetical protein